MTQLAARRLTLPRVRFRRPRPRSRWWWLTASCFAFNGFFAVLNGALGNYVSSAGGALLVANGWRQLANWPPESYFGPPSDGLQLTLSLGGLSLLIAGMAA